MKRLLRILDIGAVLIALASVLVPVIASAVVIYPPAALLQPGDITGTMIRNGAVTNVNISSTAAIELNKVNADAPNGSVLLQQNGAAGTTTNLFFDPVANTLEIGTSTRGLAATSTGSLYAAGLVQAGTIEATSTLKLRGISYTPPAADGTNGQALTTDGSKNLSWSSPGVPSGTVALYASTTPAAGWLLANGAQYSNLSYTALLSAISDFYGTDTGVSFTGSSATSQLTQTGITTDTSVFTPSAANGWAFSTVGTTQYVDNGVASSSRSISYNSPGSTGTSHLKYTLTGLVAGNTYGINMFYDETGNDNMSGRGMCMYLNGLQGGCVVNISNAQYISTTTTATTSTIAIDMQLPDPGWGAGISSTFSFYNFTATSTTPAFSNGQPLTFSTSSSLPAPLSAHSVYYVVGLSGNTFQVANTSGGSAITLTTNGAGTNLYHQNFDVPTLGATSSPALYWAIKD